MTKTNKNLTEQEETGQQAKPTGGTGAVGRDKIEALTTAMQQMQGVLSVGTGGSAPGQPAASPQKPRDTGDTAATQEPAATKKRGSKPAGADKKSETQKQVKQSVSQPESVEGFVELDKDATVPVLDHLSKKFGIQSNDLKKLSMTRGVRILFDPQYLKVQ